jgi:hypothetical protein
MDIPRLPERLNCFVYKKEYASRVSELLAVLFFAKRAHTLVKNNIHPLRHFPTRISKRSTYQYMKFGQGTSLGE